MAATTFTNTAGGTWDVGANWSTAAVPGPSDDAFINNPGTYTVTLDDTESPNSITLNDATATLSVTASGVVLANTIDLAAGTLALAGNIVTSVIDATGAVFNPSAGTLDGVTWMGPLIGGGSVAAWSVNIKDGINLEGAGGVGPGTIDIGSLYMVNITDATTLDNLTINFENVNNEYLNGSGSLAMILGGNVLVTHAIAGSSGQVTGADLINHGTIDASSSHGSFFIASTTFDNQGTLTVTGGDNVQVNNNFTNTGVVTVNASSLLTIGSGGTPSNDSTIAISSAGTVVANGDIGGTGAITLANHAVAKLHNLGGAVVFTDNKGTLDLLSPSAFTGAIEGFQKGDTIDLPGQATSNPPLYSASTGILTINNGATVVATLNVGHNYGGETFTLTPDGGTGTNITVACFAAGTRLLTAAGEVAVEALEVNDRLPTLQGGRSARVRWIGHRRLDCSRHPTPASVWPVRVLAGAFGDAPLRDLWLSPDHAVYVDQVLIPIRNLVNGTTIAQIKTPEVSYWHVELDRHDIVLAEGLPAETYLDTGNRAAFENGGAVVEAYPDFAFHVWESQSCAPLAVSGPVVTAVQTRLLVQAQRLGFALTGDPDLRLVVDGQTLRPEIDGQTYRFLLPDGARAIRLASRTVLPASVLAGSADRRRVGVAVASLHVDGDEVPAGDPRRAGGWHDAEGSWQWTDGNAGIACTGARRLEVALAVLLPYWAGDAAAADGATAATH